MSQASPFPRPITEQEVAVIVRALAVAAVHPEAPELVGSVPGLQVINSCGCGCASVDFIDLPAGVIPHIVADAAATAPDGEELGLIVWATDGAISGFEIYSYGDRPAPLPAVMSIKGSTSTPGAA